MRVRVRNLGCVAAASAFKLGWSSPAAADEIWVPPEGVQWNGYGIYLSPGHGDSPGALRGACGTNSEYHMARFASDLAAFSLGYQGYKSRVGTGGWQAN